MDVLRTAVAGEFMCQENLLAICASNEYCAKANDAAMVSRENSVRDPGARPLAASLEPVDVGRGAPSESEQTIASAREVCKSLAGIEQESAVWPSSGFDPPIRESMWTKACDVFSSTVSYCAPHRDPEPAVHAPDAPDDIWNTKNWPSTSVSAFTGRGGHRAFAVPLPSRKYEDNASSVIGSATTELLRIIDQIERKATRLDSPLDRGRAVHGVNGGRAAAVAGTRGDPAHTDDGGGSP